MTARPPTRACLDAQTIGRLAEGRTPIAELPAAEAHLAACPRCAARFERAVATAKFAYGVRDRLGVTGRRGDRSRRERPLEAHPEQSGRPFDAESWDGAAERLRGYRLLQEISRGGQATVYRAIHVATGRHVAVKAIRSDSTRERARLAREARLVAKLKHPGIVTVHDCGALPDGTFAIAMELVEGEPLDAWTHRMDGGAPAARERTRDRTRDAVRRKLAILAKVADAVSHAHMHAVVHRDLKPGNIVVDAADEPRVLDFGVAREMTAPAEITCAGEFAGTLAYAAPERVRRGADAEVVDVRSDVYSLGVILYVMLCGRAPYRTDESVEQLVRAIVHDDPIPPQTDVHGRHLDRDISTILLKALAKDPEDRYQSAAALSADIRRHLHGEPIDARRAHPLYVLCKLAARHRVAVGAAVTGVLLAIAAAVQLSVAYREANLARQATLDESIRLATQLRESTLHESSMLSASGALQPAELAIWTEVLAPSSPSAIGAGPGHPEFCAALWALRQIHARDPCLGSAVLGDGPIRCALDPDGAQAWAMGVDGVLLRLSCPELRVVESIRLAGADGAPLELGAVDLRVVEIDAALRRVVRFDSDRRNGTIHDLESGRLVAELSLPVPATVKSVGFTPDGRFVATLEGPGLASAPVDRGKVSILPMAPQPARYATIETNDTVAAYGLAAGGLGIVDLATGALLHHHLNAAWLPQVEVPLAVRSDGTVVYSRDGVIAASMDGSSRWTLSPNREPIWSFSLSRDERVAVGWCRAGAIRVVALDGSRSPIELSGHPYGARQVGVNVVLDEDGGRVLSAGQFGEVRLWESRPNRWIVRRSAHDATVHTLSHGLGEDELYSISSDGTIGRWDGDVLLDRRPLPTDRLVAYAAITADGRSVALDARAEEASLLLRDVDSAADLIPPLPSGVYAGPFDFSPTGTWLAAGLGESRTGPDFDFATATANIALIDLQHREVVTLLAPEGMGLCAVQFSPDGASLALGMRSGDLYLARTDAPGFPVLPPPIAAGAAIRCVAFSPDGARVAVGHDDGHLTIWEVASGRKLAERSGHAHWLMQVAWSPDGSLVATAAYDGAISIWCTMTLRQLAIVRDEPIPIHAMCFSRDGSRLHFADANGDVATLELAHYDRAIAANVDFWIAALNRNGVATPNAEAMRRWARDVLGGK